MTTLRKIIFVFLFCLISWVFGFFYYLYYVNSYEIKSSKTDAIAVFAGGENRIAIALQLLKNNYAPILFITGIASQEQLANFLKELKVNEAQIIYGFGGYDIEAAAKKTADFINLNRIKSLRLVTAYYNMPSALSALYSKVPYGTIILAHPIYPNKSNYFNVFKEYNRYIFSSLFNSV